MAGLREAALAGSPRLPALVLALSSVAWGLSWLPLKTLAGQGLEGLTLTLVSTGAAGLALAPVALAQRRAWGGAGRALGAIALLGGYANLSFALALIHGDVVRVMVLFYLLPVWGALGGRVLLGEALGWPRLLAVGLAVLGAFLTLGGTDLLDRPPSWADLLALTCGIAFTANNLVFRAYPSLPLASKSAAMLLGGAAMAVAALGAGMGAWGSPPPVALALAGAYGVLWLLGGSLATQWGVTRLQAARSSVLITLELVTAAVSVTWLAGEVWTPGKALGVSLMLAAALLEASPGRRRAEGD
jgi:drug/metabolite transporter (DMT)-like permease